ncbi:hypothetical protein RHSIM_Rhsim02G0170500 [Rhododendron simsii]|uniref:Reverse transcriptase RNase H-like domain-containing protein n=1 Tax=Rhododendron simsii TaxID=118357 RepID=A0A834HAD4_RHOSS|nr:hypothetical protein RHSIM_Rhsim02G0170500 [Rhododendron simsii]
MSAGLTGVRYPLIEQLAFALMISAQRLRPYFCLHAIVVLTDQPLRQVLQKPEISGRLVQWSIELGEVDIQYKSHRAMKGQGDLVEYALRFVFKATNNEAEYEAIVISLQLCNDSQLVINQCKGDTDTKNGQMKKYAALVAKLRDTFTRVEFKRFPREENPKADTLACLASEIEGQLIPTVPIEYLESPRIQEGEPSAVQVIQVNAVWTEQSLLSCLMVAFQQTGEK